MMVPAVQRLQGGAGGARLDQDIVSGELVLSVWVAAARSALGRLRSGADR